MKNIGIWLDKEKAHIINLKEDDIKIKTIMSDVETFKIHGGSGTRFKGGPQDVVQDSKYLEREKHQLKAYFKKIIKAVKKADKLTIIGPAGTNDRLAQEITENHKSLATKIKDVIKIDKMTDNQLKAWFREYYK